MSTIVCSPSAAASSPWSPGRASWSGRPRGWQPRWGFSDRGGPHRGVDRHQHARVSRSGSTPLVRAAPGGSRSGTSVGTNLVNILLILGLSARSDCSDRARAQDPAFRSAGDDAGCGGALRPRVRRGARRVGWRAALRGCRRLHVGGPPGRSWGLCRGGRGSDRTSNPGSMGVPAGLGYLMRWVCSPAVVVIVVGAERPGGRAQMDAASSLGVSDAVIGLTVIAIWVTSAPQSWSPTIVSTVPRTTGTSPWGTSSGSSVLQHRVGPRGHGATRAPGDVEVPAEVLEADLLLTSG